MSNTKAVAYENHIGDVFKAMQGVHQVVGTHAFDAKIRHLVHLRASQINGCAHCVKMHLKEAREDGESNDRLDRIVVWRHVHDFSPRERAALAWTEALTSLDPRSDLGALRAELRTHFSEEEIGVLTADVGLINFWNRFQVSRH
jgi:AhpD family alkylhydroperoxidase